MIEPTDTDKLRRDPDGLLTYECIANHIESIDQAHLEELVDNMISVDLTGQFLASAARYLHAIDAEGYENVVNRLVAATIDKDREHRYLPDLLEGVYGADYRERAAELRAADDNFRRIEKRLNPQTSL